MHSFLLRQKKRFLFTIMLLLIVLIGYTDYATGVEISLSLFYMVPIVVAAWYIDGAAGYMIVVLCVTTWIASDRAAGQTYSQATILIWNAITRMLVFALIVRLLQDVKRALAHQRMLSQTDHLTGIANRREFHQQLKEELARARRFTVPVSLVYIDLDRFKEVNDAFGHRAGDHVLRVVAQLFQSAIRDTDLVARLGGDEFAILLPNTGRDGASCIMQRIRASFREQISHLYSGLTFSAGVVSFGCAPSSVDDVIHQADAVMRWIKTRGKDDIAFLGIGTTDAENTFEILNSTNLIEKGPISEVITAVDLRHKF
jgi:diguanylate cyclase (GGDEF)-like protein